MTRRAKLLASALLSSSLAASAACGTNGVEAAPDRPAPAAAETTAPAPATCVLGRRANGLVRLAPLPTATPFTLPLELVPARASGSLYAVEMTGKVFLLDKSTGATKLAVDLASSGMVPLGMRAFALHPTKAKAYVGIVAPPVTSHPLDTAAAAEAEVHVLDVRADGSLDAASDALVLRVHIPDHSHAMGTLRFGPDGMLYASFGDGRVSNAFIPPRYSNDEMRGAIVRIDVDTATPYAVPKDNPFVASGTHPPEVYAFGFRNPWKFSFDRLTGEMWEGDVGETRTEEINRIVAGGNYGWPVLEGADCHPNAPGCTSAGTVLPVYSYTHASGNSVTGGYVYRGTAIPKLYGKYVFSDFQAGGVWAIDPKAPSSTPLHLNDGEFRPQADALGEDAEGELYVLDWAGGGIYALVPDGGSEEITTLPENLAQTGCFTGGDLRAPAASLVPYDVNVELWSDGAGKSRFLSLPPGTKLHAEANGALTLPPGGVTIKTFFDDDARPIETRILGRLADSGEWVAGSYLWNADRTDATLLHDEAHVTRASGATWTVPGPAQCFFCHQPQAGVSLGLHAKQLDRDAVDGGGSQLDAFVARGVLDDRPATAAHLAPITGSAPLETRVRSYLDANCSMCHRPGTAIFSALDLRFETDFAATQLCGTCGTNCRFVKPGSPEESLIAIRMHARGTFPSPRYDDTMMPPVGSNLVDTAGASLVDSWIRTGAACPPVAPSSVSRTLR